MSLKDWDDYFYNIAKQVASNSKCLSRKFGAVLVRDKSIISTGYNGPARGVPHCSERYEKDSYLKTYIKASDLEIPKDKNICPRHHLEFKSGEGLNLCIASHAEVNCINNAARNGHITLGCSLYLVGKALPCKNCLNEIINAGIIELIVDTDKYYDEQSYYILSNSGLITRRYLFDFEKD